MARYVIDAPTMDPDLAAKAADVVPIAPLGDLLSD